LCDVAVTDRVRHAKRYAEIARLLLKHGHPDEEAADAAALADDLERMGPAFVKLGQLLSTRSDLLPTAYCDALSRLQDDVEPLPADVVTRVVEEDLGLPPTDVFEHWEATPIASASLGQVHRARLHDGRRVVVKVQRPEAAAIVADDMAALHELATVLDEHTASVAASASSSSSRSSPSRSTPSSTTGARPVTSSVSARSSPTTTGSWCPSRCARCARRACSRWTTSAGARSPRSRMSDAPRSTGAR